MFRLTWNLFVCCIAFSIFTSCNTTHEDSKNFLFETKLKPESQFPLYSAFLPVRMYIYYNYLIIYQSNVGTKRSIRI